MTPEDKLTIFELDENNNIVKATEFHGLHNATFTYDGKTYDIPIDVALAGIENMLNTTDKDEEK